MEPVSREVPAGTREGEAAASEALIGPRVEPGCGLACGPTPDPEPAAEGIGPRGVRAGCRWVHPVTLPGLGRWMIGRRRPHLPTDPHPSRRAVDRLGSAPPVPIPGRLCPWPLVPRRRMVGWRAVACPRPGEA
jgi:hypothetical protein